MVNKARLVWSRRYLLLQLLLLELQVLDALILPPVLLPHLLDGQLPFLGVLLELLHLGLQLLLPLEGFVELASASITQSTLALLGLALLLVPRRLQVVLGFPPVLPDWHLQLLLDRRLNHRVGVLLDRLLDLGLTALAWVALDLLAALRLFQVLLLLN
jgi:hypothetical protein